jgi:hypothetical protein
MMAKIINVVINETTADCHLRQVARVTVFTAGVTSYVWSSMTKNGRRKRIARVDGVREFQWGKTTQRIEGI